MGVNRETESICILVMSFPGSLMPGKRCWTTTGRTQKPNQPNACRNSNYPNISQWASLEKLKASEARHLSHRAGTLGLPFHRFHAELEQSLSNPKIRQTKRLQEFKLPYYPPMEVIKETEIIWKKPNFSQRCQIGSNFSNFT